MANGPCLWKETTRKLQLAIHAKPKQMPSPRNCSSQPVITSDFARMAISASQPFANSPPGSASRPELSQGAFNTTARCLSREQTNSNDGSISAAETNQGNLCV